jgi:hypothetical protein
MDCLYSLKNYCYDFLLFVSDLCNFAFLKKCEEREGKIRFDVFKEVSIATEVVSGQQMAYLHVGIQTWSSSAM